MTRPDGRIDVLIDANPIARPVGNAWVWDDFGLQLVERTLVHEAQHVIMAHRGSGFEAYGYQDVDDYPSRMLVGCAAKVCDEHRAECDAVRLTHSTSPPTTTADVEAVLEALGRELPAAAAAFAQTQDVEQPFPRGAGRVQFVLDLAGLLVGAVAAR
jgi:hypothetical protein